MTEAELKLKNAIRDSASKELDSWYQKRNSAIESRRTLNRANETESNDSRNGPINESGKYVITPSSHTIFPSQWERITDLIDFQRATDKDTSRMRSILLSLKNAPATTTA